MGKGEIILSIGVLCCGRPETERCLQSLVPILEQVPSELIIVDTGCDEAQRKVIEKYATKIVPFTWINDFSAARNVLLKEATGLWFMFLDDDEFFLETDEVATFFAGGKFKEYDRAEYFVRNYASLDGNEFMDVSLARVWRVQPKMHFHGKIHEYMVGDFKRVCRWQVRVGHFGYVFNKEDAANHSRRNVPLLFEMMAEEPDNLKWPLQLAQEYASVEEYGKQAEVCQEAINKIDKIMLGFDEAGNESKKDFYVNERSKFVAGFLKAACELPEFNDPKIVIKCQEILAEKDLLSDLGKAAVYAYGSQTSFYSKEYELCREFAKNYFKLERHFKENEEEFLPQSGIFLYYIFDDARQGAISQFYATAGLALRDATPLRERLDFLVAVKDSQKRLSTMTEAMEWFLNEAGEIEPADHLFVSRAKKTLEGKTEEEKPLLSIGLLCCGRPETKRCLDSLVPILEQVPSELIIVDTGCDEAQRKVIEKYATKIVSFTWINDFAAARNVSIENASGQWFLYIDDDEWFLETDEIVDFFNSGEYKNFDAGYYFQRNYVTKEAEDYVDSSVFRAINLKPGTKFEGRIHEELTPSPKDSIHWNTHVGHFGYVFETDEELWERTNRNRTLLLEVIKEEPEQLRWPAHLTQEYRSVQEFTELRELCLDYLKRLKGRSDRSAVFYRGTFVTGVLISYYEQKPGVDSDGILKFAEELRASGDEIYFTTQVILAAYVAEAKFRLEDFAGCLEESKIFFKGEKELFGRQTFHIVEIAPLMNGFFVSDRVDAMCNFYLLATLQLSRSGVLPDKKIMKRIDEIIGGVGTDIMNFCKHRNSDSMAAIEALKKAMKDHPAMTDFLAEYTKSYAKVALLPRDAQFLEMVKLEENLRAQAKAMPGQNEVVKQLEEILMKTYGVKSLLI